MSHICLASIRRAHIERIADAFERLRHRRGTEPEGLPDRLVDAGCWLVAQGWDGDASPAEAALGWGPARYRAFLTEVGATIAGRCIEDGRQALFEGRHPIFPIPNLARAA